MSILEVSISSLPVETGNPPEVGRKDSMSQRGWRRPGKHGPLNQVSKDHVCSKSLKHQANGMHGSTPGPLHLCYGY